MQRARVRYEFITPATAVFHWRQFVELLKTNDRLMGSHHTFPALINYSLSSNLTKRYKSLDVEKGRVIINR